jgi:hypothetical protein
MKFSPSCTCCGCRRYIDSWPQSSGIGDEWEQVSGTWVRHASGTIRTSDNNALLMLKTEFADPIQVGLQYQALQDIVKQVAGVRAIFGYKDVDNYMFLGRKAGNVVLGARVAAVETILQVSKKEDRPWIAGDGTYGDDILFLGNTSSLLTGFDAGPSASIDRSSNGLPTDGQCSASIRGLSSFPNVYSCALAANPTWTGPHRVGIGTTELHGGEARLSTFAAWKTDATQEGCPPPPTSCGEGPLPPDVLVEIQGTYSGGVGNSPPLPQINGNPTYTLSNFYDERCIWSDWPFPWPLFGRPDLLLEKAGTTVRFSINQGNAIGGVQFETTTAPDSVSDWTSEFDLPLLSQGSITTVSNALVKVRLP